MDRLSGDQNGLAAPAVPASGRSDPERKECSHNLVSPSDVAVNAIVSPSGEIARPPSGDGNAGVTTSKRRSGADTNGVDVRRMIASVAAANTTINATNKAAPPATRRFLAPE